jgi:predicted Zn finger-like uncharacterized protein
MNIACTACSARYGVADEKLIGKRVRITCKRCGTVLIIDGNTNPPTVTASTSIAPSPPASVRPSPEAKAPAPVAEPPFMVVFADGRQEQADIAQIVRFHRAGQLGADSLVWRDGMSDWTDPWDVPEIAAAFKRMGYSRPAPPPAAPAAQPLHEEFEEEATQVVDSSPQHRAPLYDDGGDTNVLDSSRLASPSPLVDQRAASRRVVEEDDAPTHVARAERGAATHVTPAAREAQRARRVSSLPPREAPRSEAARATREAAPRENRGGARDRSVRPGSDRPRGDLFAGHARAGSEDEQRAAAAVAPGYEFDIPKLTGARNESSVLFSLDTLLKQEQKPVRPARPARRDESMLVDTGSSLPAGGGFAPALAAPDFTAPVTATPFAAQEFADTDRARSSRAWLYVLVLLAFAGAGAFGWKTGSLQELLIKVGAMRRPPALAVAPSAPPVPPSASASSPSVGSANSAQPATSAVASASAGAAASAAGSAVASAPSAAVSAKAPVATTTPHAASTGAAAVARSTGTNTSAPTHEAPTHEAATHEAPAATTAPAAAAASEPFDTASAKETLTAAAGNASSCKEMGGPIGNGKVSITFAPSGRATSVAVTGDLAGTTVGSCVARLFRGVHVPAFSGDAVTVAKSFSIQ